MIYFILKHRTNIFSDSLVSPSSKDAIIPEIRINEAEDKKSKSNSHSFNEKNDTD